MEVEVGLSKTLPRLVGYPPIPTDAPKRESCCLCHDLKRVINFGVVMAGHARNDVFPAFFDAKQAFLVGHPVRDGSE